jgi:hypothetical protein
MNEEDIPKHELVIQRRDVDGPMVDRALEIVKKFIIERRLIIFGGQAIDYALRLKGKSIYPDDQRPDLDFLSPNSVEDAYDLADILYRAGFNGVGVVRGIHVQTMRVKVDFIWVADIGYAPTDVYESIPTLDYMNLRIVHPDFQRMDMHLAFCYPYNNPPGENVFYRWKKDLKRFNLIEEHYPIGADSGTDDEKRTVELPVLDKSKFAFNGFTAYAILSSYLSEVSDSFKIIFPVLSINESFEETVTIASPWPQEIVSEIGDVTKHAPYMDMYPESYTGKITVMSTQDRLLAISRVGEYQVVGIHYLLLWFLYRHHVTKKPIYLNYYKHTLDMIEYAETVAAEAPQDALEYFFTKFAPFAPVLTTLGDVNHNMAYTIKMAGIIQQLHESKPPPEIFQLKPDINSMLVGLPANYYPENAKQRPTFNRDGNALFLRSGQQI